MAKIIAVANQKGGVGKTTTTINLSSYLAGENKKVLIVDIDAQGNACSGLGVSKNVEDPSIYEVLLEQIPIQKVIQKTSVENLHIVPVNINLVGLQIECLEFEDKEFRLKKALDSIRDLFDYVLIDCPPSLGIMTINALVAADSIIIPLQCEFYALEGLAQLMKTIQLVQRGLNHNLSIEGIVLTMYDVRTNLGNQVIAETIEYFKEKVYKTIIPRNIKLAEAPSYGLPISHYDTHCVGAKSYKQFMREFLKI